MSKITKITAFFLFFVVGFCVQNMSAANFEVLQPICLAGKKCCKIDGVDQCVEDTGQICLACGTFDRVPMEDECTAGASESKYTASGCTYTTSTRNCCSEELFNQWSGWGEKCCSKNSKPITSQTCTNSAGYSGTQTRTVTCNRSTGTWTTGSWSACSATAVCTPGDTRDGATYCNGNKFHQQVCGSNGQWGACGCINQPDKYYTNVPRPADAPSVNGMWSYEACYGMCCCSGSYGILIEAVAGQYKGLMVPQCKSSSGTGQYTYACACINNDVSSGLELQPNL